LTTGPVVSPFRAYGARVARHVHAGSLPGSLVEALSFKEVTVILLWVLVALLLLFAIVGGVAITKFLFFLLIVAAILALIGFFSRTA